MKTKYVDMPTFNVRVERELKDAFTDYCKKYGFSISQRIRILMQNEIDSDKQK
jgi:antitoxin component of RelBE/YafQ-DinJ toxin-antitoxin module